MSGNALFRDLHNPALRDLVDHPLVSAPVKALVADAFAQQVLYLVVVAPVGGDDLDMYVFATKEEQQELLRFINLETTDFAAIAFNIIVGSFDDLGDAIADYLPASWR